MAYYIIVHLSETDGDPVTRSFTELEEVGKYIEKKGLHVTDFALIKGYMVKSFASKQNFLDLKKKELGGHL